MINETTIEDQDLLTAWVIHFSLAGCSTSVLREKLKKPSNIHFWESVAFDESQQFDLIYFLTHMFLSEDIETLKRIILQPEEIHELVQQMASVRKSLNESGEFNEANYRTEIDRQPFIRCNLDDQKCVSFELLVTDLLDPDHNLRGLLRDLQASFNTRNVARGIEVRDSSCVTLHNVTKCSRDKDNTVAPSSQRSKQTRRKGIRNWKPTLAGKNAPMTLSSSKSAIKSTKKNPSQIRQKKSRKRRISLSDRKSFSGEILKMRRIETYFKPIPKKIEEKCSDIQNKKANGRSSLNSVEIYTVEDDSDSSIELIGNVFHRDHARVETHDSIIDELVDSLEEDCITLSDKTRKPVTTPIHEEALDISICVTKENLPHCHATQVTQMSALKAQNVTTDLTLGTEDNCTETYHIKTAENTDISDSENNTSLQHYDKNVFQLDATTKEMIRDWCGGDTFLTQDSPGSSGEVMEQEKTTDKDNDNVINEHRKFDDDDDDDDDDDNSGLMNGDLYCNEHNMNNDKSDSNNESDDDNDDDDGDDNSDYSDNDDDDDSDDDDDIESDDINDKDYVYDSEDESDSESDKDYKKNSNKFKHILSPRNVQRKRFQRKNR